MLNQISRIVFTAMFAALVSGPHALAEGKLRVVTTTSDLASIVGAIGGDKVEVSSLGTGKEDPHFIDAKPSCMALSRDADLWVRIGLELEIGYERLVIDGSHNLKIRVGTPGHFDASEGVIRLEVPTGKIDRSMGDIHPMGNPHYWLDPLNMRIVAKNVAARLGKLRPGDQAYFNDLLKAFLLRLDESMFGPPLMKAAAIVAGGEDQAGAKLWALLLKDQLDDFIKNLGGESVMGGWYGEMRPLRGTKIITYHRSWSYFANRFGLEVVGELEPKPGIEPTASHLSDLVATTSTSKVSFILMEPFYSRQAPDWLSNKTGITVVQVANSVGGQPEATDYIRMIDGIVKRSVAACTSGSKSATEK
ncbi:MAG: zinc ABC transporter substrate-binding protein [Planctomycetes bacterium]|nr:zinc ABC transporter substrate-binding protein [Planctomycetota bacterium]